MTDKTLIERLRSKTILVNKYDVSKAMFEAADEIERLRMAIRNARRRCGYAGNPEYVIKILDQALKENDDE
jgi:hypothetical protein